MVDSVRQWVAGWVGWWPVMVGVWLMLAGLAGVRVWWAGGRRVVRVWRIVGSETAGRGGLEAGLHDVTAGRVVTFLWRTGDGGVVERGFSVAGRSLRDVEVCAEQISRVGGVRVEQWDGWDGGRVGGVRVERWAQVDPVSADRDDMVERGVWGGQVVAEMGACQAGSVLAVGLRPGWRGELRRLRAYFALDEQRSMGTLAAGRPTLGTATASVTAPTSMVGVVVSSGVGPLFEGGVGRVVSTLPASVYSTRTVAVRGGVFAAGLVGLAVGSATLEWLSQGVWWPAVVVAVTAGLWWLRGWGTVGWRVRGLGSGVAMPDPRVRWFPWWQVSGLVQSLVHDVNPTGDERGQPRRGSVRQAYPWRRCMLVVSPGQVGEMLAGVAAGESAGRVDERQVVVLPPVPPRVAHQGSGAVLGVSEEGVPVRVPWADRWAGVAAVGEPGTGKTTVLLTSFWSEQVARVRRGGFPADGTSVWLEVKEEGDRRCATGLSRLGFVAGVDGPRGFDWLRFGDRGGVQLAWWDESDPVGSVSRWVDAVVYASKAGSFENRSQRVLRTLVGCCVVCPEPVMVEAGLVWADPLGSASRLAGSVSYRDAREVVSALGAAADRDGDESTVWVRAVRSVEAMFSQFTDARLADVMSPAAGLFSKVEPVGWVFRRDGRRVAPGSLIDGGRPVVLSTVVGDDESTRRLVASMTLHVLWASARRVCVGWEDRRRVLSLYCDELAVAAGGGGGGTEIVAEMVDQGRSLGLWWMFGTQSFGQLDGLPNTQRVFGSAGWRVVFRQTEAQSLRTAVAALDPTESGEVAASTVEGLRRFSGLVRARSGEEVQPLFGVLVRPDGEFTVELVGQ